MFSPKKLLFGTAGIPVSCSGPTIEGITSVHSLGLDAMELEFVHSINITKEKAPLVREAAQKNNIVLTCHAPYYINLNSAEAAKLRASEQRILNSCRICHACGGWSVCFHAGFYMGADARAVLGKIKESIKGIMKTLNDESIDIWVRPEISGKPSAFGNLEELIELSASIEHVMPCIDFSHLHARTNGKNNSYDEFCTILEALEKSLGKAALHNMHIHMSGIEYTEKGERNHLILEESDMKYKELMKALKDFHVSGVLISESPNIEGDALLMKKTYEKV